jgi:hypothetical protein
MIRRMSSDDSHPRSFPFPFPDRDRDPDLADDGFTDLFLLGFIGVAPWCCVDGSSQRKIARALNPAMPELTFTPPELPLARRILASRHIVPAFL